MPNPVYEFQIISKDPDATAAFYAGLFGWSVNTANAMGYRELKTGSAPVGCGIDGGIWPAPPQSPNFIQLFISVDDLGTTMESAVALGATVIVPLTTLPDGDAMAILHDPQGMSFGICRRAPR